LEFKQQLKAAAGKEEARANKALALRLERAKKNFLNLMDLETGRRRDIIIRSIAIDFWNEWMEVLNTPDCTPRLCVVGTPGIGKSTISIYNEILV
jgi:hypothetical protein